MDEMLAVTTEDIVKTFIEMVERDQNLKPPAEIEWAVPDPQEVAKLKSYIAEVKKKIGEIAKVEKSASKDSTASQKLQGTVRRLSKQMGALRRMSSSSKNAPGK